MCDCLYHHFWLCQDTGNHSQNKTSVLTPRILRYLRELLTFVLHIPNNFTVRRCGSDSLSIKTRSWDPNIALYISLYSSS